MHVSKQIHNGGAESPWRAAILKREEGPGTRLCMALTVLLMVLTKFPSIAPMLTG